jgi:hypothetical protein
LPKFAALPGVPHGELAIAPARDRGALEAAKELAHGEPAELERAEIPIAKASACQLESVRAFRGPSPAS